VTDDQLLSIRKAVRDICRLEKKFSLHLSGVGVFPDFLHPQVLWVGIDRGAEGLKGIAEKLSAAIFALGLPREDKTYLPHLTIGRFKSPKNLELLEMAIQSARYSSAHVFTLERVLFYKSTLTPDGPVYEPVDMFPLVE
jgi:2'-5' RNA ligase